MSRHALGPTHLPIHWVPGALSWGVKWLGCETDHSSPSRAEVKEWVALYLHSPNTPSWRGAQLKHRDNFTFTFAYVIVPDTSLWMTRSHKFVLHLLLAGMLSCCVLYCIYLRNVSPMFPSSWQVGNEAVLVSVLEMGCLLLTLLSSICKSRCRLFSSFLAEIYISCVCKFSWESITLALWNASKVISPYASHCQIKSFLFYYVPG